MGALGDLYESYFGNEEVTRLSMVRVSRERVSPQRAVR